MSLETLIRHRTEKKELRLSGDLVMTRTAWEQRGGTYHGSLGPAAKAGWFTVRECERMGAPVTETELKNCKDFAMFKDCYTDYCLEENGKRVRPCLPVFFREKEQK